MKRYMLLQGVGVAAWVAVLMFCGATMSARAAEKAAQPEPSPLAYNGEFVEVTQQNTLRNRYHSKDFQKNLAFYLERAKKSAEGRKPGRMRIMEVLIRQIDLVDGQGKTLAVCKIPDNFITEVKEYEKLFGDFVFASSDGAMMVEWLPAKVIDNVKYGQEAVGGNWWFNPKSVESQLEFLKAKDFDVDFLFFYLHVAKRTDNSQDVSPEFGGMAYGNEEIKGARFVTLNDHELARGVHEWQHHIFDTTIQETEGMTVSRGHGLFDAGYKWDDLSWGGGKIGTLNMGPCVAYYSDLNRYYNTRDMWERWRLRPAHNKAHEPFSGKAYQWAAVKPDYWFLLPRLEAAELRKLTGLEMVRVAAPDSALIFDVGAGDDLASPRLTGEVKADSTLNNAVNFLNESAAFLKTPTGKWLFVKPQLADVYVDMLRVRGTAQQALPVYGYVLEGCKALLAIKLPDDVPSPTDELSLFRPIPIAAQADGLLGPDDYRFEKSLSLSLKSSFPSDAATIRYTLDGSEPTEQSPAIDRTVAVPIKLSDTTTVKARRFGEGVAADLPTWCRTFEYRPFSVTSEGLMKGFGTCFDKRVTIRFTPHATDGTIRYTLDGNVPDDKSPAYERPIVLEKTATVTARYFDAAGKPRGYTWSVCYEERNLALGRPVEASGGKNENEKPEYAVDGLVDVGKYWGTIPAPQWLRVDLEKEYTVDRIHIFPYWDGARYYQYTVEVSTDGKNWTQVVDGSKNTTPGNEKGYVHTFNPTKARYVKVNMLKNSDNPAVHLVELQVFEARK